MDVCDLRCASDDCPGGMLVDEDVDYFAKEKGMNALKAVHITTACLSVLGSLFVMVTFHLIPTHRGASLRIVYWLSVSDLVTSFVYIVDGGTTANEDGSPRCPNGLCVVLAALSQVFNLSAIVWNTYIALNMHLTVLLSARIVKECSMFTARSWQRHSSRTLASLGLALPCLCCATHGTSRFQPHRAHNGSLRCGPVAGPKSHFDTQDERKYLRWLHAGAWGPALLSTFITGAAGGLGSSGQWCWIRRGDFAWAQVLFSAFLPVLTQLAFYRSPATLLSLLPWYYC